MTSLAPAGSRWIIRWPWLALIAVLATGWFIYRPALTGAFLLDDQSNLAGLRSVSDGHSALQFVLSGESGPLGRPIALASFVPQAAAWQSNATPFLQVNVFIHLLNGFLVFLLARQLARAAQATQEDELPLAVATTAVWLFMPLLASSSLLIVQRMTTLSATFVLTGINAYVLARKQLDGRPGIALLGMSVALIGCTVLAVLTKENGALLPVLILTIELILLKPPPSLTKMSWNAWRGAFLVLPTVITVAFLLVQVPYSDALVARRGFTATDRLLSEARILWEYLINAFFAPAAELGPFHETRQTSALFAEPLLTLAAVVAWILAIVAAVRWRKQYPVATFAVFWFLAGHLLESTTIPLELYFEHRNYVPIIGPVFALCYYVIRVSGRHRVISRIALALYAVINAGILFSVTSMWGNPLLAATYWYRQDPASVRAATTLASQQLKLMQPEIAIDTLRGFASQAPHHAYIRIPELNLACKMAPRQDHSDLVNYLKSSLPTVAFSLTTGEMLDQLLTTSIDSQCDSVRPATIGELATTLINNRKYRDSVRHKQFHHMLMARIARVSGDTDATLEHLAQAIDTNPSDDLNFMTVVTLVDAGRYDDARSFINEAKHSLPFRPLKRINSNRILDDLLNYVNQAENLAGDHLGRGTGE